MAHFGAGFSSIRCCARRSGFPAAFVRGALVGLALVALGACSLDPLGKPCAADDQCGPGYDCFRNVCFQVCTNDGECRAGQICHRYHCLEPGEETQRASSAGPAQGSTAVPPTPDATIAELRAMRRELEVLRRDVARLLAAQGLQSSGGIAAPGVEKQPTPQPKKSVITLPPAAPAQPQ